MIVNNNVDIYNNQSNYKYSNFKSIKGNNTHITSKHKMVCNNNCIDEYSNTRLSSRSNIFINIIANDICNTLKNKLTDDEYALYKKYIIGKQLRDILDKNNQLKMIENKLNSDYVVNINNKIKSVNNNFKNIKYDAILLSSYIKEIIDDSTGLDAIVLENKSEYYIISSCCDSTSKEDVMAISYALLYQITGSDELWISLSSLLTNDKGKIKNFDIKDIIHGSKYYSNQRQSNINLINKYTNKGKKVYLYGFSLGGGIMLDSYARLRYQDPIKYSDLYLTVFNPFTAYLEIDSQKYHQMLLSKEIENIFIRNKQEFKYLFDNHNTLIDALKQAKEKVLIYSTEGDTVSQFTSLTKELNSQIVYIKGNKKISSNLDINDATNLIMGEDSRHSFNGIDLSVFDKNGILKESGNPITINEIVGGKISTNNIGTIIETIIDNHLEKIVGDYFNSLPRDEKWMKNEIINMYFDFRHYLINNAGHYNSEELIDSIIPSLTRLLKQGALMKDSNAFITNMFITDEEIKKSLKSCIENDEEMKKILDDCLTGKIEQVVNKLQSFMTDIYYKTSIMQYINDIQNNYQKGYDIGKQLVKGKDNMLSKGTSYKNT